MKLPLKGRTFPTIVIVPSVIVVIVLGILQYRWSTSVSEATAVRLADSLQMSMVNWQMDFFRYFSEVAVALRAGEDFLHQEQQYVRRLAEWKQVAKYPQLVSNVYILNSAARRLDDRSRAFLPSAWPHVFDGVRADLQLLPEMTHHDVGDPLSGWRFEPAIPALFHALKSDGKVLAVELNRREIQSRILPELVSTYFQGTDGLDFLIAVIDTRPPGHVLYTSDHGFGSPEPRDADGAVDIFGQQDRAQSAVRVFHMPSDKGTSASVKISWFQPLSNSPAPPWRLVVRHRRGGALGAFIAEIGRRDLAIGLGMMLVLVVNMGMLIITSHRAQRLAELQMNFVTAVSHELRTPLAVILSGADNLGNGVVETKSQVLQYGSAIGNQARHLVWLVEQILLFASTRQGHHQFASVPMNIAAAIHSALADLSSVIEMEGFQVETEVEPGLPQVIGDPFALSQCLQNLITNALKYGRDQRWVRVQASLNLHAKEIEVRVSDRGPGINATDLLHIFEPFYRSPAVRDAQIRGTGLGLTLSRSLAEAMKGRISVESLLGSGSSFTLHLPVSGCNWTTIHSSRKANG